MMNPEIAYILWRFPSLTETFIANELWEIQKNQVNVRVFSLLNPQSEMIQPVSKRLLEQGVTYAPALLSRHLWWAQMLFLLRNPLRYLGLLGQLLRQPYPNSFFSRISRRCFVFLKAVALAYLIRENPPQLLHTHFAHLPGAATTIISGLLDVPFTVTIHAYDIYAMNSLLCMVLQAATRVVSISEHNKDTVLKMCPSLTAQSIEVIHCGIDLDQFNPLPRPLPASDSEECPPFSIISVGSLIEKKGHKYLIEACEILKNRGLDFRCDIFGGGPLQQALHRLIQQFDLEEHVVLHGPSLHPAILEACQRSDLFVLASVVAGGGDRDGIPVVLMEAAAMELPIVSTTVSGIPEIVQHGDNGLLVPERDAGALADAIFSLATDEKTRLQMGQNGRRIADRQFQLKNNIAELTELFRTVTAQS